jgi:exonuclease SbcC
MLSFNQLQQRVSARFSDFQTVEENIIRFVRKSNDHPFAVCYLALNPDLPSDEDELAKYQDRVVGSLYFEGTKSLQWSNYLYFITNSQRLATAKVQRAKEWIENNRSYARKFVVSDQEVDEILAPPVAAPEGKSARPSVISIWTQELQAHGLDKAIFSDEGMPSRLSAIEATEVSVLQSRNSAAAPDSPPPAFLSSLQLVKYRPYPLNRDFDFGTMNLLFGPNATGKTSLLEAIELLYCGRNNRNDDKPAQYELVAKYADGKTEKAVSSRALQLFRDRNLAWYGQPEVLTNNLYQSFSKFNFLDTDAAVRIAESTEDIDQDLSKLLIGPEASRIWDNISRVHEALESRLRDQKRLKKQLDDELAELVKRLASIASLKQESDSIEARLRKMLQRLHWLSESDKIDEKAAGRIVSSLAELIALAEQATSLNWIKSPISRSSLAKFATDAAVIVQTATASIGELEAAIKKQRAIEENIKRQNEVSSLLGHLRLLVEAQVPERIQERTQCEKDIAANTNLLVGFDSAAFNESGIAAEDESKVDLQEKYLEIRNAKATAQGLLQKTSNEYARFTRLRQQSLALAQELRSIASRIIEDSENADECPLCHTNFAKGKLAEHMNKGVDGHFEQAGQALLKRQREEQVALNKITSTEAVYSWLVRFCERASAVNRISVARALASLNETRNALESLSQRQSIIEREIATLERRGLSERRLQEIRSRLSALKKSVSPLTLEAIDEAVRKTKADVAALTRSLQAEVKACRDRSASLQGALVAKDQELNTLKSALTRLKECIATTLKVGEELDGFSDEFPWSARVSLADLVVSANSISSVAANLQKSIGQEKQDRKVHADLEKRRKQLAAQATEYQAKLRRLQLAYDTLSKLRKDHSLQDEMNAALLQNRKSIEMIFSQIHAPVEFVGLSEKFPLLRRKKSEDDAKLTEISTGQRAAYALSIFLAQNSQLTSAPPVMLIDDPIAHVDDLNALSFLDYLREVTLRGNRQIFFATANDKLATLIERKFDFLGSGFKKITLNRAA